jgi:hypothetical protein
MLKSAGATNSFFDEQVEKSTQSNSIVKQIFVSVCTYVQTVFTVHCTSVLYVLYSTL